MENGVFLVWVSNSLNEAERVLDGASGSIRIPLHIAEVSVMRAAATGDEALMKVALKKLEEAEKVADSALSSAKSVGQKILATAVLADAVMMKGGLQMASQKFAKGALALRKAYKTFESLTSLLEFNGDDDLLSPDGATAVERLGVSNSDALYVRSAARFGIGIFTFALSVIPKSVLRIVEFVSGIKGDQEKGLLLLRSCADGGGARSFMGRMVVVAVVQMLGNEFNPERDSMRDEARRRCDALVGDGEACRGFINHFVATSLLRQQWRLEESLAHANSALALVMGEISEEGTCRFVFTVGMALFSLKQFDGAARQFQTLLSSPGAKTYTAVCLSTMMLALAQEATGKSEEAFQSFATAASIAKKSTFEQQLKKSAATFQARIRAGWPHGLGALEFLLVTGPSVDGAPRDWLESSVALVEAGRTRVVNNGMDAVSRLLLCAYYRALGRLSESVDIAQPLVSGPLRTAVEKSPESFAIGFGLLEVAKTHLALKDIPQAADRVTKLVEFARASGCLWDRNLQFRAKAANHALQKIQSA